MKLPISTLAHRRANATYYERNRERLKAKALARWRRMNGKPA